MRVTESVSGKLWLAKLPIEKLHPAASSRAYVEKNLFEIMELERQIIWTIGQTYALWRVP